MAETLFGITLLAIIVIAYLAVKNNGKIIELF